MCLPQGKPYNRRVTGFLPDALNSIARQVYPSNWTILRPRSSRFITCFYLHSHICRRPLLRMAQRKAKLSSYQFFPLKLYHITGITPQLRGRGHARSSTRGHCGQAQAGTISVHPPALPPFQPHPYEPLSMSQVAAQVIPPFMSQGPSQLPAEAGTSMHQEPEEEELCYSLPPLSWYLSLFLLTPYSFTLWYVLIRLGTFSDSFEFLELFFDRTITRAVLPLLLPDGMIHVDSLVLTLILDSLAFRPILSYRTRSSHYSSIPSCSMEFHAYASPSISRQLHVL